MIPILDTSLWFPDPHVADEQGAVAVGGDLSAARVLLAYYKGIFPWFSENEPIVWWSPDPRMVLFPSEFKISKSFKKTLATTLYKVTFNTAFKEVVSMCANIKRTEQEGTWITNEMEETYIELHEQGIATSVEVWDKSTLVGGLYGIDLSTKKIFCGESMFHTKANASKIALAYLVVWAIKNKYRLIDCQMHTNHLESLGAKEIPRGEFLSFLR